MMYHDITILIENRCGKTIIKAASRLGHSKRSHNRSVYASPPVGGSGYEKPHKGRSPTGVFRSHIFAIKKLLRSFFIATAKMSYTARTLCEMAAKVLW
jgi:hypothetical protein